MESLRERFSRARSLKKSKCAGNNINSPVTSTLPELADQMQVTYKSRAVAGRVGP